MAKDVVDQFMETIPLELKDGIRSLLDQPQPSAEDLLAGLDDYTRRVDTEVRRRQDLEVNLAEES